MYCHDTLGSREVLVLDMILRSTSIPTTLAPVLPRSGHSQGGAAILIAPATVTANLLCICLCINVHRLCSVCFLPARRYASAGNSDRNVSVCLSVRPSVRLSRAGIVSKRRKLAA